MEFNIRIATIQDINQVYEIEKECFKESERLEKNIFYFLLQNKKGDIFLIAETKQKKKSLIVGFIVAYLNLKSNFEIITLNVSENFREKGIATKLMLGLEIEIQSKLNNIIKRNEVVIELVVYEFNHPAIQLYQKLGYKDVEYITNYYSGTRNGIKMQKKISLDT